MLPSTAAILRSSIKAVVIPSPVVYQPVGLEELELLLIAPKSYRF